LTLKREFGTLDGLTITYIGDFANVARSLSVGTALVGARMVVSCPPGYGPSDADVDKVAALGGALTTADRPEDAVALADCVTTDAWYSMGQEAQAESRVRAFEGFTIDTRLMSKAPAQAVFLHCLPAHRGQEVTSDVLDGPQSRIWRQAANRMHAARGLLAFLLGEGLS
jgi:ornithine carbamoyltransferase